jgi:hypothetical protein
MIEDEVTNLDLSIATNKYFINKYFCEVVFKGCWHEFEIYPTSGAKRIKCIKCDADYAYGGLKYAMPDYFSKEGFWDIFTKAKETPGFMVWFEKNYSIRDLHFVTFAEIFYKFLERNKSCQTI